MPGRQVCGACLRVLRQRSRKGLSSQLIPTSPSSRTFLQNSTRALNTSTRLFSPSQNTVSQSRDVPPVAEPQQDPVTETAAARSRSQGAAVKVQQILKEGTGSLTETYRAFAATERLFHQCATRADYNVPEVEKNEPIPETPNGEHLGVGEGWWHETLGLEPTFSTWTHVSFLHMWLITTRLRRLPPDAAPLWHQHMTDHFFYDAEDRMITMHNIATATTRSKYLKDLFDQWRGAIAAYDEGFMRGDMVLAAAIWRNVFKSDASVKPRDLTIVVSYVRRSLLHLDRLEDRLLAAGDFTFPEPGSEVRNVDAVSWRMSEPSEAVPSRDKACLKE